MYIDFNFAKRLSELRTQKGVSARDMSLSLGQNHIYPQNRKWDRAPIHDGVLLYM